MKRITHWMDGKAWGGVAERTGEVFDPAMGTVAAHVAHVRASDTALARVIDAIGPFGMQLKKTPSLFALALSARRS